MATLKDILNQMGQEATDLIKANAPVVTGQLLRSIDFNVVPKGDSYEVKYEMVWYGEIVDKGDSKYNVNFKGRDFYEKYILQKLDEYTDEIGEKVLEEKFFGKSDLFMSQTKNI